MLHVDIPSRADIEALISDRGAPRVSIYLPTSPVTQHSPADRIAFKNLVGEALGQLADLEVRQLRALEEGLLDLVDDDEFWDLQAHSLGVFATLDSTRTFRLPNRVKPRVEVSDRFLIKPLLRAMAVPQAAFVLALSQNNVRVVEVSADLPASTVDVEGMPKDAASSVGKASIRDRSPSGRIQGSEGSKVRLAQYSRKVDLALRDLLSGRETPLILATTEPLLSIYRSISTYPHLAKSAIVTNPETMSDSELAAAARSVLDELFQDELSELRGLFQQRGNEGRSTTDLSQAARAATFGAIQTLLVDIDNLEPGTINEDGAIQFADGPCPESHSLVDEIASRALVTGARVLGVRHEDIPGGASLAAILRYPV